MTLAEQLAHDMASEIADRYAQGKALGRPSVYNVAREVIVERLSQDPNLSLTRAHYP